MRRWRSRGRRCASIQLGGGAVRARPRSGVSAACQTRPSPNSSARSHRSRHSLPRSRCSQRSCSGEGVRTRPSNTCARSCERNPSLAGARAALGSALAGHGRLDDAIAEYDEAVRLAPGDAELRHALGLCLARRGRIPDAVVQLSEAVRIRPGLRRLAGEPWNGTRGQRRCPEGRGAFQSGAETQPPQPRRASGPSGTGQGGWRSMTIEHGRGVAIRDESHIEPGRSGCSRTRSRRGHARLQRGADASQTHREVMAQGFVDPVIVVDDAQPRRHRRVARDAAPGARARAPVEPRLRRQPEDLLRLALGGRRHRGHGPSRLPVHADTAPGDGLDVSATGCILRARLPHPGRPRAAGRNAPGSTWQTAC